MQDFRITTIRHGESPYKGEGDDLTELGVSQIHETAEALKETVDQFDNIIFISSSAPRAKGSARVFAEYLEIQPEKMRISRMIRPVDIKNLSKFLSLTKDEGQAYGAKWLFLDDFEYSTNFCEGRNSIKSRSSKWIETIMKFINDNTPKGQSTLVLAFTHFEVIENFMQELRGHDPLEDFPATNNAEFVNFKPTEGGIEISARGRIAKINIEQ